MTADDGKPSRSKKHSDGVAAVVLLCVVGLLIWWLIAWLGKQPSSDNSPKPTYNLSLSDTQAVNPATVSFVATVVNTGSVAGRPTCRVAASDVSGNYSGQDWFDLGKTLQPGEKSGFRGVLTITKEGAAYVTKWSGGCA